MGFAIAANTCNTAVRVLLVATARTVCEAGSMQLLGVRPSVPLADAHRCCGFTAFCFCGPGGQEISIYCCTAGGPAVSSSRAAAWRAAANAGSATLSADVGSWTQTCRYMKR